MKTGRQPEWRTGAHLYTNPWRSTEGGKKVLGFLDKKLRIFDGSGSGFPDDWVERNHHQLAGNPMSIALPSDIGQSKAARVQNDSPSKATRGEFYLYTILMVVTIVCCAALAVVFAWELVSFVSGIFSQLNSLSTGEIMHSLAAAS